MMVNTDSSLPYAGAPSPGMEQIIPAGKERVPVGEDLAPDHSLFQPTFSLEREMGRML